MIFFVMKKGGMATSRLVEYDKKYLKVIKWLKLNEGTPYDGKLSRTVWNGGKSRDRIK